MKKKILYIVSLGMMILSLTGCVKFNANMDIKKDKSMDFSIIYAFDTSILGDQELMSEEDKKAMEEKGFSVQDYKDGNMKGFTISKNIKNIDAVSSKEDIEYSISGILDEESDSAVFKIKKEFLKNTYIANFSFDTSDSGLEENNQNSNDDYNYSMDDDYDFDTTNDYTTNDSDIDFSQYSQAMMSNLDLSFNVKLPYAAKSNNATSTNNDNKELKWNLATNSNEMIEFEFELYNMLTIYIIVGVVIVLIIAIVGLVIFNKKKKNKDNKNLTNQSNASEKVIEHLDADNNIESNVEELIDPEEKASVETLELQDKTEEVEKPVGQGLNDIVNEGLINQNVNSEINNENSAQEIVTNQMITEPVIQDVRGNQINLEPIDPRDNFQAIVKQTFNSGNVSNDLNQNINNETITSNSTEKNDNSSNYEVL